MSLDKDTYIQKILDGWPPLTDEQRTKLAELLKPVRVAAVLRGGEK